MPCGLACALNFQDAGVAKQTQRHSSLPLGLNSACPWKPSTAAAERSLLSAVAVGSTELKKPVTMPFSGNGNLPRPFQKRLQGPDGLIEPHAETIWQPFFLRSNDLMVS
jgi:hypothetical protein